MSPDIAGLSLGVHRIACPVCKKGKHDKALKVTVEPNGTVWFCHRCQSTGSERGGSLATRIARPTFSPASTQHLTLASHWRDVWRGLETI